MKNHVLSSRSDLRLWFRRHQAVRQLAHRSLNVAMLAAGLVLTGFLTMYPQWWAKNRFASVGNTWRDIHIPLMGFLEERWSECPPPPVPHSGREEEVRQYLEKHPEIEGIQQRGHPGRGWQREGGCLVPAGDAVANWFTQASRLQPGARWSPSLASDPSLRTSPAAVLATPQWLILKRWTIGSPQVEAFARAGLPSPARFRFALFPAGENWRGQTTPASWHREGMLQVDAWTARVSRIGTQGWTNLFTDPWILVLVPDEDGVRQFNNQYRRLVAYGVTQSLAFGLLTAAAFIKIRSMVRRRQSEAARLATLTHSLKTPLAVLKLRCDMLRLAPSDPQVLQENLLQFSESIDRINMTIMGGLATFHRGWHWLGPDDFEAIPPEWLEEFLHRMTGYFHFHGRELCVALVPACGLASPDCLQVVLQTLLENALQHGRGETRLATRVEGRNLVIQVAAGGEVTTLTEVRNLFIDRRSSRDKFARGFGLPTLLRMAKEENWGLQIQLNPGGGILTEISIPLHEQETVKGDLWPGS